MLKEQNMNISGLRARRAREQRVLDEMDVLPPGIGGIDEAFDAADLVIDQPWRERHEGAE